MNTHTRCSLALLNVLAAFGLGACMVATAPPPPAGTASAPAGERYQDNAWMPGGNLRTFDLPQGGPEACAAACESRRTACYAYTYVKPEQASKGVGQCTFKHNIPLASKSACCVSGVIRPWP